MAGLCRQRRVGSILMVRRTTSCTWMEAGNEYLHLGSLLPGSLTVAGLALQMTPIGHLLRARYHNFISHGRQLRQTAEVIMEDSNPG